MQLTLILLVGFISVLLTNKANLIAIQNYDKENPVKSSFLSLKYNYFYIFISSLGFNVYYPYIVNFFSYSVAILIIVLFNVFISLIIQSKISHKKLELNQILGIILLICGIYLTILK